MVNRDPPERMGHLEKMEHQVNKVQLVPADQQG
jgi:hypothetical protein